MKSCACGNLTATLVTEAHDPGSDGLKEIVSRSLASVTEHGELLAKRHGLPVLPLSAAFHRVFSPVFGGSDYRMSAVKCNVPFSIRFLELVAENRIPVLDASSSSVSVFTCSVCRGNLVLLEPAGAAGSGYLLEGDKQHLIYDVDGRVSEAFGLKLPEAGVTGVCDTQARGSGAEGLSLRLQQLLIEYDRSVAAERDRAIQACLAEQYAIAAAKSARARAEAAWLLSLSHPGSCLHGTLETVPESDHSDDASSTDSDSSSVASSLGSETSDDDADVPAPTSTPRIAHVRISSVSSRDTPAGGDDGMDWCAVGSLMETRTEPALVPEVILPKRPHAVSVSGEVSRSPQQLLGSSLPIPVMRRPVGGSSVSSLRTHSNERNESPLNPSRDTVQSYYRDDRDVAASLVISELERMHRMAGSSTINSNVQQ